MNDKIKRIELTRAMMFIILIVLLYFLSEMEKKFLICGLGIIVLAFVAMEKKRKQIYIESGNVDKERYDYHMDRKIYYIAFVVSIFIHLLRFQFTPKNHFLYFLIYHSYYWCVGLAGFYDSMKRYLKVAKG